MGLLLLGLVAVLAGCNEDDVERSMGRQTAAAVEKEYGLVQDPLLAEWVNVTGQRLVGQSFRQNIPYSFKVVNTDMVNAFAAPWGYVYVTRGLLDFATSEDEIGFVVGHEVGHVANRDSIKSVKKSLLFSLGSALVAGKSRSLGDLSEIGSGLLLLHYSREDERDADIAGAMNSYGAGFDPAGGEAFFARLMKELEKDRPSSLEHLFLTHPETASRIAALRGRPEMNLKDAAVASHIGRGYARRYAFARAAGFYNLALQARPSAVNTRLALAEAYRQQGLTDRAQSEYQAVLQADSGNRQATLGMRSLTETPARSPWSALTPGESQSARGLLGGLYPNTTGEVQGLLQSYQAYASKGAGQVASASGAAKQSIGALLGFADKDVELGDKAKEAYVLGNGAVSAANNAAFTLEGVSSEMLRVRDQVKALTPNVRQALDASTRGEGLNGDVAAYQRGLIEVYHAAKVLDRAADAANAAAVVVNRATAASKATVTAMNTMLAAKDHDRYIYGVRTEAQALKQQAQAAQDAARKVKKMTMMAEARTLLAKLNLMALGASPTVREAYDGMVAHYCGARPAEVRALRTKGLGFGDAAFVLSSAQSNRVSTDTYLGAVQSNELVTGLQQAGVSFDGPVVLLRFLVKALEDEAQSRASL